MLAALLEDIGRAKPLIGVCVLVFTQLCIVTCVTRLIKI
ncbi:hypothetical protein CRENPOLYSF2_3420003 [Crenothrix polyspora]|uniref:Uncharacterized protein n=1 Tax=Crenothrix polyspora TaxID=360316 RepID=A0A1R4HBI0_9GAMM|nr:hypothetical protein CRENPOLYSF2_3420003 [Crenothrix polyspora]